MIEKADQYLKEWVQAVLSGVNVAFSFDSADGDNPTVVLLLLDILRSPPAQAHRLPLKVTLKYLVSISGGSPESMHTTLGRLIFAALEETTFETRLEPIQTSLWQSLGVHPRPAFTISYPLSVDRPTRIKRVREVVVRYADTGRLRGKLVDQEHNPIPGAAIELTELSIHTQTDRSGTFLFEMVPRKPEPKHLRIRVGSWEITQEVVIPDNDETQIIVPINLKEM